jgi:hypothetical protein
MFAESAIPELTTLKSAVECSSQDGSYELHILTCFVRAFSAA